MTREEAIQVLKEYRTIVMNCLGAETPAFDMAIEALSAKSEQTIRHIENNAKESDLVYRPSADDTFCKSQLITCNRVKECNGVCPFEDALQHADKTQTMDEQHTINHDRAWIIGCIEHDGFIHTHRFDKANQIIHDALSAEARPTGEWIPVSEKPKDEKRTYLVQLDSGGMRSCRWTNANPILTELTIDWHWNIFDIPQYCKVVAWMDLEPYKGGESDD